ncbi:uncharacterized protein LOC117331250 [Pecten maximus]|uniref:uncharacterized protein LOC117331250 n=1 Tax=Pecten maximus TaxID=6579 RepID=UPI001458514D|nr:uncharacterized protein LOC117331250 [Pecten maximus]
MAIMEPQLLVSLLLVCISTTFGQYWGFGGCPKCRDNKEVHPMISYCKATYALKIKAEGKTGNRFTAQVLKDYKNNLPHTNGGRVIINTDCADYFVLKKSYIILASGYVGDYNQVSLNMQACDFSVLAKDFACAQRTAFASGYDCNCMDMCVAPKKPYEDEMKYRTKEKCFNKYVLCETAQNNPSKCIMKIVYM